MSLPKSPNLLEPLLNITDAVSLMVVRFITVKFSIDALFSWELPLIIPLPFVSYEDVAVFWFNSVDATDELNVVRFTPLIFPVVLIEPVIPKSFPNWIELPPDDVILFPSCICKVPLTSIKPLVGSNNKLPPPDVFNWISPSADCKIILSLPASNIFIDCPTSVVICNSWLVEPNTFVPSM